MIATSPTLSLGFGMQGHSAALAGLVREVSWTFSQTTYIEIGVARGETLSALAQCMRNCNGKRWRAVGVELPDGYSFDYLDTSRAALRNHMTVQFRENVTEAADPMWGKITVYLMDSHVFIPCFWRLPIHLALIDGCHCYECAHKDFSNIEEFIEPGGIVMFHDFGEDQQDQPQPRGHKPLDVRGACRELGLLDNKRDGWEFVRELVGDKKNGSANIGVFQKL